VHELNAIWHFSGALSVGLRLMNWKGCGRSTMIEEGYTHFVESRGVDPGQDFLQIFAGPFEFNFGGNGEDGACQ
jgi:hypothetical protein